MNNDARVVMWGSEIGAVSWLEDRNYAIFQYSPDFLDSEIELAPVMMPLAEFPYEFPELAKATFHGLPGLLADSLPDKFGNAVIDTWLASEGRSASGFHPVERLCYTGRRGMGALEFEPATQTGYSKNEQLDIESLVSLANRILDQREQMKGFLGGKEDKKVIDDILRVGTSAGGARAKAVLAWNPETGEFRSGQVDVEQGFEHWLLKFDGISNNRDKEVADPKGFGNIEYAYYLMAIEAGIEMAPCRLHLEGGRSHFMTKRFDRTDSGGKLHMQSLGAMAHYDYNQPSSYSYEQAIQVMRRLNLKREEIEELVARAFFNIIGRNHDDHVKNIAFLMNRRGDWRLSPAFDVAYAFDPEGVWTSRHQMSLNGKRNNFVRNDLISFAEFAGIKPRKGTEMVDRIVETVKRWPEFAEAGKVRESDIKRIKETQRTML